MVLPLTLISSGGTLVAVAPVVVVALLVLVLAAAAVVSVVVFCPVSAGGGAVGSRGFATSPVRVSRVVATMRHVEGVQVRRRPGVSTSTCSLGARASNFQSPSPQRTPSAP